MADYERVDCEQSSRPARDRKRKHIDKQLLEDLYLRERKSTVEIADILNVNRGTVTRHMDCYGIPRREPGVAGAEKCRVWYFRQDFFECIDDPDKAYVLGFILGDGTLQQHGRAKRCTITLADSDGDHLEAIAEVMGCREAVQRGLRYPSMRTTEQSKARLVVTDTKLVNDLIVCGIPLGRKSGNEPYVDLEDVRLQWAFIRGVFDADGHVRCCSQSGRYRQTVWQISKGLPLVTGIKCFLESQGLVISNRCVRPISGTGLLILSNSATVKVIGERMYRDGTLWLERKRKVFDVI